MKLNNKIISIIEDNGFSINKVRKQDNDFYVELGLWHGRVPGYKILKTNVSDILRFDYDYAEFYDDGYNIKGIEVHHDGVNYYEYRVIREDRDIDRLLNAIYNGEKITRKKLNYYTKSLRPYVAKVYGW